MAAQLQIQVAGNANAGPTEVELNNLALRLVARPKDVGFFGHYSVAGTFKFTNQTVAISGFMFGIFWQHMTHAAVIDRINFRSVLSVQGTGSNGIHQASLFRSRYTENLGNVLFNGTAGNIPVVLYPTTAATAGSTGKLYDNFADASAIVAIAGAQSVNGFSFGGAGSFLTETNPLSALVSSVPLVSGSMGVNGDLWNTSAGDFPLVLSGRGQCLLVQFSTPTASVQQNIDASASITWKELGEYP